MSKFLRRSSVIFIIKGFRTIVFIFIVISTMFQPICPPAFFRCWLSKFLRRSLVIFIIKGFRTIVFIFIVISTMFQPICPPAFFRCWLSKFLRRSLVIFIIKGFRTIVFIFIVISITIKMKTIARKPLMIKITLFFANRPGGLGSISGWVIPKTLKWYLMPPCFTLSIIRYG